MGPKKFSTSNKERGCQFLTKPAMAWRKAANIKTITTTTTPTKAPERTTSSKRDATRREEHMNRRRRKLQVPSGYQKGEKNTFQWCFGDNFCRFSHQNLETIGIFYFLRKKKIYYVWYFWEIFSSFLFFWYHKIEKITMLLTYHNFMLLCGAALGTGGLTPLPPPLVKCHSKEKIN